MNGTLCNDAPWPVNIPPLDKHSIIYHMEAYTNGAALLAREAFDILFLDIVMEPFSVQLPPDE